MNPDQLQQHLQAAEINHQQAQAVVSNVVLNVATNLFSNFVQGHFNSEEELTPETGQRMAGLAMHLSQKYSPFLLQEMGVVKVNE